MLQLLRDMYENSIILTDESLVKPALHHAVRNWPPKFRKYGLEILRVLAIRNRFIRVPSQSKDGCQHDVCRAALGVVDTYHPDALVKGTACAACPFSTPEKLSPVEVIDVREYSLSQFESQRRQIRSLVLGDGEVSKGDFAKRVLVPVLADAKHVRIVDRHIGRSIDARRVWENLPPAVLPSNYKTTLEWLIDLFSTLSRNRDDRTLEVYCGLTIGQPDERAVAIRALRDFETEMREKYGAWLSIHVKDETGAPKLPHGRYLLTDQISILIERGFDLLWSDDDMRRNALNPARDERRIRDVTVVHCADCGSVEASVRSLKDLS